MNPVSVPHERWSLSLKRPDGCNLDVGCDEAVKLSAGSATFFGASVRTSRKVSASGEVIPGPDYDTSKTLTLDLLVTDGSCCGCCTTGHPEPELVTAAFGAMASGLAELCFVDPRTGEARFAFGRPLGAVVRNDDLCQPVIVRAQFEMLDGKWYSRKHTSRLRFFGTPSESCFPICFDPVHSFAGGQKLTKCVQVINCGTVPTEIDVEVDGLVCGFAEITVGGTRAVIDPQDDGCVRRLPMLPKGTTPVEVCLTTASAVEVRLCWRDAWK